MLSQIGLKGVLQFTQPGHIFAKMEHKGVLNQDADPININEKLIILIFVEIDTVRDTQWQTFKEACLYGTVMSKLLLGSGEWDVGRLS